MLQVPLFPTLRTESVQSIEFHMNCTMIQESMQLDHPGMRIVEGYGSRPAVRACGPRKEPFKERRKRYSSRIVLQASTSLS